MKRFWLGLLLALIVGVFYSWLQAPEWLQAWNAEHKALVESQRQAGLALAQQSDQQGCFDAAVKRVEQCQGSEFECTVGSGTFLKACWSGALPSSGFCDAVPAYNEKATEDDKAWRKDRCFELQVAAKGCQLLMRQQQQFCSSP